jgi:hypothetical protein
MLKQRPWMEGRGFMLAILDQGWSWGRSGLGVRIVRVSPSVGGIVTR